MVVNSCDVSASGMVGNIYGVAAMGVNSCDVLLITLVWL